jgi:hypothetical protein
LALEPLGGKAGEEEVLPVKIIMVFFFFFPTLVPSKRIKCQEEGGIKMTKRKSEEAKSFLDIYFLVPVILRLTAPHHTRILIRLLLGVSCL